jgi:hypothetical protein
MLSKSGNIFLHFGIIIIIIIIILINGNGIDF